MREKINEVINNSLSEEGTIVVLKGYSVLEYSIVRSNIQDIINNKSGWLVKLAGSPRKIISYDEFVCAFELIISQFRRIIIIENSIYLHLFPIDVEINDSVLKSLLIHFNSDIESDEDIGQISEYTNTYGNFIETDKGLACCYNFDENLLKNEKVQRIIIESEKEILPEISELSEGITYSNLCSEVDYYQLVYDLSYTNKKFAVVWENFLSGKDIVYRKLQILAFKYPSRIQAYKPLSSFKTNYSKKGIYEILKKYWNYDGFRDVPFYNILQLENKQKEILNVSQEKIISDIIDQAEECLKGEIFRDIFVTAPTGSGKSIMFQIPAIYLAEKHNLLTIVVTPLIGLMNDQVQSLKAKGYSYAQTINSDISPIIKQEILEDVANSKCHILYLSPESLLSRSDLEQLIGKRKIGLLVIDEAHIVTTWGKQFRPDYWYLGDHVQKLRKSQSKREIDPSPFIIATFTATAIYEGREDMYHETLNSLHMIDPITYLGYIRRENISIEVSEVEVKRNKTEYEMNKFDSLIEMIELALTRNQKTLIYFPTVALINRFHDYCFSKNLSEYVTKYHGQMEADSKDESFKSFLNGDKMVMLATKAFGMGIDIPNISIVSHFAPTGNVCDYMQEIGRAARDKDIQGHAIYTHMKNDFAHINRLHGLSAIQKYQLIEVIKKILELYTISRYNAQGKLFTKRRNEMLVDAESFAYIFDGPLSDENDLINKVKTAMLLIQKDYENRGFSPFYMRPIPLFAYGFFSINPKEQTRLNYKYSEAVQVVCKQKNVCKVDLKKIWERSYDKLMSFPKFKYLLYSNSAELDFNQKYQIKQALSVEVFLENNYEEHFEKVFNAIKDIVNMSIMKAEFITVDEITKQIVKKCSVSKYKAESITEVFLAAINIYQKEYTTRLNARMFNIRITKNGVVSYHFLNVIRDYFNWFSKRFEYIKDLKNYVIIDKNQTMYIVNDENKKFSKEITTVLGVLESMGVLRFKTLGGSNSQIYIYVNETKNMQIVRDKPNYYKNRLYDMINKRHKDSVDMLTFLFQSKFNSEQIWEHLENYFLGILPVNLNSQIVIDSVTDEDVTIVFQLGESLTDDYSNWNEVNALFDNSVIGKLEKLDVPLADYYAAKLLIGDESIDAQLAWTEPKVILSSGEETQQLRNIAKQNGWNCIPIDQVEANLLIELIRR